MSQLLKRFSVERLRARVVAAQDYSYQSSHGAARCANGKNAPLPSEVYCILFGYLEKKVLCNVHANNREWFFTVVSPRLLAPIHLLEGDGPLRGQQTRRIRNRNWCAISAPARYQAGGAQVRGRPNPSKRCGTG
jgi:hypothetical protein